jgi:hypothetical protein
MRFVALVCCAVAALLFAAAAPRARSEIPLPDDDPFYTAPADLADRPNGSILDSRPIPLLGLPVPVVTWQVRYRTTDSKQQPISDVATVMVPPVAYPGPRPLLAYQVAEDSLGTRCAPSFALRGGHDSGVVNTALDVPFIAAALSRGWAVVVTDYEGPRSRFFDGVSAGRAVLDGIRAARAFPPAAVGAGPIGAWGYSGGAFAALWAAQLQPAYAPDVVFSGVSAGGVPADIPAIARQADGGPMAGLAMLTVVALARGNTGSGLADLLNDRGRELLATTACGADLVRQYRYAHVDDYSTVPNLLAHPRFRAVAARQQLGGSAPITPLYLYHSSTDDRVPVGTFDALVDRYCALGATLTAVHSPFPTHNGAAVSGALGSMAYLSDRFAGVPADPGCVRP